MKARPMAGVALALVLLMAAVGAYAQQKTTIKAEVVTGTGSGRVFIGPIRTTLAVPLFRDPFTGNPFINEVSKDVSCENLQAGDGVVIFNCTLSKNVKYKTIESATLQSGPPQRIETSGDVVHVTLFIDFAGSADVPGALPGDNVQLEGFTVNQKITALDCVDFVGTNVTLQDAQCSTLEEKDDILVSFKTTRTEQVQFVSDP